ncbi:hypothetical protein D3C76_1607650 [compost metagenome]
MYGTPCGNQGWQVYAEPAHVRFTTKPYSDRYRNVGDFRPPPWQGCDCFAKCLWSTWDMQAPLPNAIFLLDVTTIRDSDPDPS